MAHSLEDAVSHSPLGEPWLYTECNLRRSPSWELRNASPRGRYGERYTHATMLRGAQANFMQKASTKPTLPG